MENNQLNSPKSLHKGQDKDTNFQAQTQTLFLYLLSHTATASMISEATGIPHKNICRFKRKLEKLGQLWQVEKKPCKITGFQAWYLTTNPDLFPAIAEPSNTDKP